MTSKPNLRKHVWPQFTLDCLSKNVFFVKYSLGNILTQKLSFPFKILGLVNQHFVIQIFSFMIDLFTPKRFSRDCPFKGTQRQAKKFILTPWCDGFTPRSLTLRCNTHRGDWLCGAIHTAEIDSNSVMHITEIPLAVWCTTRRLAWQRDPHCRDCLCGVMRAREILRYCLLCGGLHTTEFLKHLNIWAK